MSQDNNTVRVVTALIIGIGAGVIVGALLAYFTDYSAIGVGAGAVLGLGLGMSLALRNGGGES